MPNLVGIGLSQVPTNSMLGGLAYQDPEHASIKNLDLKNLSQINSEIADTAVDVFVYDTRKDSDGGAWRKRTQHTSWYNETLNTSTRGSRKEFPAVAVIVLDDLTSTGKMTIYDGDDPDLPMWMVFTGGISAQEMLPSYDGTKCSCLSALNGQICVGNSTYDLEIIDFIKDGGTRISTGQYFNNHNISTRNSALQSSSVSTGSGLVNRAVNDVAMTVRPNAPVDSATGLPVPTIAVATNSGVSVIRDDGTVDSDSSVYGRPIVTEIEFKGERLTGLAHQSGNIGDGVLFIQPLNQIPFPEGTDTRYPFFVSSDSALSLDAVQTKGTHQIEVASESVVAGGDEGIGIIEENKGTPTNGMIAHIAKDFNTGYQHGDIKGAFLSDTTVESLTANTNLASNVLNGGTNRLTSHTYDSGDTAWQMVDNASSANGYVSLDLRGLTIGQSYVVSMTWDNNATLDSGYEHRIAHLNGLAGENATNFTHWNKTNGSSVTLTGSFVAQSVDDETLVVYANAITLNISNFNIRAVDDEDRSVNNNGLAVYGTVTKSAVATGAELVAYSGFSASNHLRQPPNSNMHIGTGDAYSMIWYKTTVTSGTMMLMSYEGGINGTAGYGKPFNIRFHNGNVHGWASHNGFTTYDDVAHPVNTADGFWHCVAWVKRGQVFELYVDGEFAGSDTGAVGSNALSDANTELVIGARKRGKVPGDSEEPFTNGSLALARIGKTAPSPEQIKKIYEDEKFLFQENAKATLYGSSDAVTVLAFDDTTNLLHVGTSAGRSEFQGLRRINNTTTAVTTAISASNGLIVEQ